MPARSAAELSEQSGMNSIASITLDDSLAMLHVCTLRRLSVNEFGREPDDLNRTDLLATDHATEALAHCATV